VIQNKNSFVRVPPLNSNQKIKERDKMRQVNTGMIILPLLGSIFSGFFGRRNVKNCHSSMVCMQNQRLGRDKGKIKTRKRNANANATPTYPL
jgi:hypothetical protein